MYQKKYLLLTVCFIGCFFICSCAPEPEVIPTISPSATEIKFTDTPMPTATVEPTSTPTPLPTLTDTLEPSQSATPTTETPLILSNYLINPVTVKEYSLNANLSYLWAYRKGKISGGQIVLKRVPEWDAYFITNESFQANLAYLARFSRGSGANYNIGIQTGEFDTPSFRGWSIHGGDKTTMSNRHGEEWLGDQPLIGNLTIKVNDWYYVLLAVNTDSKFLAVVWDANDPTRVIRYDQEFGSDWSGKDWKFRIGSKGGEVYLNYIILISFDDFQ